MLASTALCASILMGVPGYVPAKHYRLKQGDNFAKVAKLNNLGYERLMDANPSVQPEKAREGLVILVPARLPKGLTVSAAISRTTKSGMTLASNTGTTATKPEAKSSAYYVRNGDNDWTIAPKFGITAKKLREMNPTVNWQKLQIGQPLRVPLQKAKPAPDASKAKMTAASNNTGNYKVKSGDNDWIIARRYGITPTQLRKMNSGVKWDSLQIGQALKVPGKSGSATATMASNTITSKRVAVNRTDVTVRSGPSTSSRRVTLIDRGQVASVVDSKDGWHKLRFSTGLIGWVRSDMLKPVTAKESVQSRPAPARMSTASRSTGSTKKNNSSPTRTMASGKGAPPSLLGYAQTLLGTPYRWGGNSSRSGLDCSGFTTHVFAKHGIKLPRTSISQSQHGEAVAKSGLKQGDLVFFRTRGGSRVSHVGIYMGGGKFIHASSGGGKVQINSLNDGYYSRRYAGARRVSGGKNISVAKEDTKPAAGIKPLPKVDKDAKTEKVVTTNTEATPPVTTETSTTQTTQNGDAKATEERPSRVQQGADTTGR